MGLIEQIENLDRQLLIAINQANSSFLDELMWLISKPAFGIPFYILFIGLLFKSYGWKNALLIVVSIGIAVGLADLSAKYLFKEMFLRYRPSQNLELKDKLHYVNDYHGGMYGFVSSHAANMFCIATLVGFWLKHNNKYILLLLFLWAGTIGYSRIYLGVHYPTDVFCGALLGMLISFVIYKMSKKLNLFNFNSK